MDALRRAVATWPLPFNISLVRPAHMPPQLHKVPKGICMCDRGHGVPRGGIYLLLFISQPGAPCSPGRYFITVHVHCHVAGQVPLPLHGGTRHPACAAGCVLHAAARITVSSCR